MTNQTAIITVNDISVTVEVLDSENTRKVSSRIVESLPVPVSAWPWSRDEIEEKVRAVFATYSRNDRADLVWAVDKAGNADLFNGGRYFFRAVPTDTEHREIGRAAREEARDGLT